MNADFQQLAGLVRAWYGRKRLNDLLLWLPRGVLGGLFVAVILATVARLRPFLDNTQVGYAALALGLAGLLLPLGALLLRHASLLEQARFADRQFRLKERLSTAVEIQQGALAVPESLAALQLQDAAHAARGVDVKNGLPWRVARQELLMLVLVTAVLVAAVLLPNPQENALKQSRALRQTIAEQITALEVLEKEILANTDLDESQQEALLEPVQNALEALDAGNLSQEQVVATLSEAEAELRSLGEQFSTDELRRRLQEAGQSLADNQQAQSLGEALQNGQLAQAGAAAAQLADALSGLSAAELAELAADLAETAAALQDVDAELARQLAEAAQSLQNGDIDAAQQALRQAAATLQQRAQQTAAAQQAQSAAGQLQQGRQEVAQSGQPGQSSQQGQAGQQGQFGQQGQTGQTGQSGSSSMAGTDSNTGTGTGGPGPGGGHVENIFVPNNWPDLRDIAGVDVELPAECLANPALCGGLISETPTEFSNQGSTVPYSQVFGDYRNAAYEALSGDYIPLGLKGFIRDYFSSLEP